MRTSEIALASPTKEPRVIRGTFRIPMAISVILLFGKISTSFGISVPATVAVASGAQEYARLAIASASYFFGLLGSMRNPSALPRLALKLRIYFLFIVFAGMSAFWSAFPETAIKFAGHCIGLFLVAVSTALTCVPYRMRLYVTAHFITIVLLLASVVMVVALPTFGIMQIADASQQFVGRWKGVMAHPNLLGMVDRCLVRTGMSRGSKRTHTKSCDPFYRRICISNNRTWRP
jgi:hypothetical protein